MVWVIMVTRNEDNDRCKMSGDEKNDDDGY